MSQVQKLKVFEVEIESSMTKREILKIFRTLENVEISTTQTRKGLQSVRVGRGMYPNEERFDMSFDGTYLELMDHTGESRVYMSPTMKKLLGGN